MRLFFSAIAICCIHQAPAQNVDTVQNALNRFLPFFEYKQELKNCVFMKGGEFMAGRRTGGDSVNLGIPIKKNIHPFFISKFEVRNKDYRGFVTWVRDSIAHVLLKHFAVGTNNKQIDWTKLINWKDDRLDPIMVSPDERIYGRKEIDANRIIYKMSSGQEIAIYPDTLCWIRDFAYSYNEPMTKRYFQHPAFGNYPVVGVTQLQALAYCDWKTVQWNNALLAVNETKCRLIVRLPSSEEWEYAATPEFPLTVRDTAQIKSYQNPTGYKATNYGYKYNFGKYYSEANMQLKSYIDDGFFYTAPGNTYKPDSNGLYNLLGNVAEWTASYGSYQPLYDQHGINQELSALRKKFPNSPFKEMEETAIDAYLKKYVIVKGGGWSDEDLYLQTGINQYYLPGSTVHCYLGFRIAVELIPDSN